MRKNNRARRLVSTVAFTAALVAGGAVTAGQAFAATGPHAVSGVGIFGNVVAPGVSGVGIWGNEVAPGVSGIGIFGN
ncbi:hypothetical protein [Kitasatospora brasiliensis]|uniref:hypothetical protein n=1 Tax=Kitasatospora brasiliensis TaxID=3058040 RepID=UPI00292FFA8B|nr:hypothetical protein [Kitasatospora sp. K002]